MVGISDGFWTRPRMRRLSWFKISAAFCLADFLMTLLAGPLAFSALADMPTGFDALDCTLFGLAPFLTLGTLYERGLYGREAVLQPAGLRCVTLGWLQAFGLLLLAAVAWAAMVGWRDPQAGVSAALVKLGRPWIGGFLMVGLLGLLANRVLWSAVRSHLMGRVLVHGRAVVVGTGPAAEQVIGRLRDDPTSGLEVVGVVDDGAHRDQASLCGITVLGGLADLVQAVRNSEADTVIVAVPWAARARIAAVIAEAGRMAVDIRIAPDAEAAEYLRYPVSFVAGQCFLDVLDPPISGVNAIVKRGEDLVAASLALLILAPVLLAVAVAIKLDSPGPLLFRQSRRGFNNRVFQLCKFRSMHADMADEACAQQTSRDDPRLTRVGTFLRRHSLDELPQLLNVLRGEMSIVGPRPHALSTRAEGLLLEEAVDSYIARLRVKPGITGWAQVNGWRGELDTREKLERRVEFDLDYIARWSLLMDLRILWLTLPCVIRDSHAF